METKKRTRHSKISTSFDSEESKVIEQAARSKNMRMRQFIREKSLLPENEYVLGNHEILLNKPELAIWYVQMLNTINNVESAADRKSLQEKMEAWSWLVTK